MNESVSFNQPPKEQPDQTVDQTQVETGDFSVESISDLDSIMNRLVVEDNDITLVQLAYEATKILYPVRGQEESSKIESPLALYKFAEIVRTDDCNRLRSLITEISWSTNDKKPPITPTEAGLLLDLINKKTSKLN